MRKQLTRKATRDVQKISKVSLSDEELNQLKEAFDLFDVDGSGIIETEEIGRALEDSNLERRNPVVFRLINELKDVNGAIDFDSFVNTLINKLGDTKSRYGIRKIFELYDADDSGTVNFEKLKAIAKELGESMNDEELEDMLHFIHIQNGTESNTEISFEEFYNVVSKKYLNK